MGASATKNGVQSGENALQCKDNLVRNECMRDCGKTFLCCSVLQMQ